ncbi:MAG TPA: hypothetical protein VGK74_11805 [Symbiobacteriaceae bacterium]|jgi:hypothetical protein
MPIGALDAPAELILDTRVRRLQAKPGNGLKRYQSQCLQGFPVIPDMLRAAIRHLVRAEEEAQKPVYIGRTELFHVLLESEEHLTIQNLHWVGGEPCFSPAVKVSLSAWQTGCIIARRIGLFACGHRGCGLSPELRKQLARAAAEHPAKALESQELS